MIGDVLFAKRVERNDAYSVYVVKVASYIDIILVKHVDGPLAATIIDMKSGGTATVTFNNTNELNVKGNFYVIKLNNGKTVKVNRWQFDKLIDAVNAETLIERALASVEPLI